MTERRTTLLHDLLLALGHSPERPPLYLTDEEAARVLRQKRGTLAVWRSTGRHGIPFTKLGRCVYYRPADVVDFLLSRIKAPYDA